MLPDGWLSNDLALTGLLSACSLLAVWVPFWRGAALCGQAKTATRRLQRAELAAGRPSGVEPIARLMLRVLDKSLRESSGHSSEFVLDAARQYALNEYESHYARPISMYANILPPIGFIGTTGGLLILFFSMRVSSDSLELGALALALTSSIFALVAFAVLEGMKIRFYRRLLACLDHAVSLWRSAGRAASAGAARIA